jgi:hypothetical protein
MYENLVSMCDFLGVQNSITVGVVGCVIMAPQAGGKICVHNYIFT